MPPFRSNAFGSARAHATASPRVLSATLRVAFVSLLVGSAGPASAQTNGRWTQVTPLRAIGSAEAVYDPVGQRVIAFGGNDGTKYLDATLSIPLTGARYWKELAAENPPSPRSQHSAVYDPTGHRMVVFGGYGAAPGATPVDRNDLWMLPLGGAPVWREIVAEGTPPPPQHGHAATYDSRRRRMLIVDVQMRVWSLSLDTHPRWEEIVPAGITRPTARRGHTATYDPVRDRVVIYGGAVADYDWELRLSPDPEWVRLATTGTKPGSRSNHSAIYDPVGDRILIMSGVTTGQDLWALSLGEPMVWIPLTTTGLLPGRRAANWAVHDPRAQAMVVPGPERDEATELMSLTLASLNWTGSSHELAGRRIGHVSLYDPIRDRMVVFGGYPRDDSPFDTWVFDFAYERWSRLDARIPVNPGSGAVGIYDPVADAMVFLGGGNARGITFVLDLGPVPTWRLQSFTGPHTVEGAAAYDPLRRRMLVFGGLGDGTVPLNSLWSYGLDTGEWSELHPDNPDLVPGVVGPAMIYDPGRDRLIVHGGTTDPSSSAGNQSAAFQLPLSAPLHWSPLTFVAPKTSHHLAVHDSRADRMLFFSGLQMVEEVWTLPLSPGSLWQRVLPQPSPSRRYDYGAFFDGPRNRYVLFAGYGGYEASDLWYLSFDVAPAAVAIDIVPGNDRNTVALGAQRLLPVAILSDPEFDAATVDPATVKLGRAPVAWGGRALRFGLDDLNGDGRMDALAWFEIDALGVGRGVTTLSLTGAHGAHGTFTGSDLLRVTGGRNLLTSEGAAGSRLSLGVQPNPTPGGSMRLRLGIPSGADARIELLDLGGRRVWTRAIAAWGGGEHELTIRPERRLAPGVYWLRLASGALVTTTRVVVIE